MKLEIKCQDLIEHLTNFAYEYHLGRFIREIIQYAELKTFKDIKEAFESYDVINVKEVFNEEYINKIVSSHGDYNGIVLIKTKDRSETIINSLNDTLTIECSLEEYSKLNFHQGSEKNILAILKRENISEDRVLTFDEMDKIIKKYKIVLQRIYLDDNLYKTHNILSCDYHEAVLIEK